MVQIQRLHDIFKFALKSNNDFQYIGIAAKLSHNNNENIKTIHDYARKNVQSTVWFHRTDSQLDDVTHKNIARNWSILIVHGK